MSSSDLRRNRHRPPPPPQPPGHHHHHHHHLRCVDPKLWRACAGTSVQIPAINSTVIYFPQGHIEHSSEPINHSLISPSLAAALPCLVLDVLLLANPVSDEVFAKFLLQPNGQRRRLDAKESERESDERDESVVSFAKVLTPSDANNGGGFSVPRFCADSIFPALDYRADPPVQNVRIRDVHGEVWEFRHIYRGTPRRHLLTTGWSKFVNSKKLIAGDSIVFMKSKRDGELSVGIRRAVKTSLTADFGALWGAAGSCYGNMENMRMMMMDVGDGMREGGGGFSRSGKGKLKSDEVVAAVNRAASGLPFDVVYYPKAGWPDFVVGVEKVGKALSGMCWLSGVRVKMAMETEDSSRMTWFQGTVSSVVIPESGPWRGSPWRMLQVAWDEPEVLQNVKHVSPWEVEYVAPTPLPTVFPPTKRLRVSQNPLFMTEGEAELSLPMIGFGNSMLGQFGPPHLNYNAFPAGMQGARQNTLCVSSLPNFINGSMRQVRSVDDSDHTMAPKEGAVSTELNIGTSRSESPPDSANSVEHITSDPQARSSSVKTLQLFGQIIHVEMPVENFKDVGSKENVDSQVLKDTESRRNMLAFPLSDTYRKLIDELSVQCQSVPVVEV